MSGDVSTTDSLTELVLEKRLMHFLRWCGIRLEYQGKRFGSSRCEQVVDKYVNE
jgi:hypothetical protein